MNLSTTDFYNLYNGGNLVTEGDYLWPLINQAEDAGAINIRRKRSSYPNFQFKLVEIYKNYVFCGKPKIQSSSVIDMRKLANSITSNMLIGGTCYVLTLKSGIPKVYRADSVEFENGIHTITGHDDSRIEISNEEIKIYHNEDFQPIIETRVHEDQFICCFWNEARQSLMRDTAAMNVQIYNFQSVLDSLVLQAAHFNTTGPSLADTKRIRPYEHVPSDANGKEFSYASPDTSSMDGVRDEIESRIMNMAAVVGLVREFSEQLKIDASGVAHAFQMFDTNATIMQIAKMTEQWANRVADVSFALAGGKRASISLDPLLSPKADEDKLSQLRYIRDNIDVDDVIVEANIAIAEMGLSHLTEVRREELSELIRNKGVSSSKRTEIDFN